VKRRAHLTQFIDWIGLPQADRHTGCERGACCPVNLLNWLMKSAAATGPGYDVSICRTFSEAMADGGESLEFRIRITLQQIERQKDWAMMFIVRAEFQVLKNLRHHAAIVTFVGISDHHAEGGFVGWSRGLRFAD
jgi:hypothetical protein